MRILIAGAGIGGLTAALSLHAAGFESVHVLESAADLKELGVGINVLPNAVRELFELGLLEKLALRAVQTQELLFCNRFGDLVWREPRGRYAGHRWPQLSIHRGFLQSVLAAEVRSRLGAGAIVTDARVQGWADTAGGRVQVNLAHRVGGASTLVADLLIGADGVRSAVRAQMYPQEGAPRWNKLVMWRGTSWARPYLTGASMVVSGDATGRWMVFYPILPAGIEGDDALINWVVTRPTGGALPLHAGDWNHAVDKAEVLEHFGDWRFEGLDIKTVLQAATEVHEYPMVDREPLPRWTAGRVTLLGDAAHPMYPMGSNGATQAIIDGRSLAYHLATCADIDEGLAAYDQERRPVTAQIQNQNRQHGPEAAITLANQRAPNGFKNIDNVIPRSELAMISERYAQTAGFNPEALNQRPSYSTPPLKRRR